MLRNTAATTAPEVRERVRHAVKAIRLRISDLFDEVEELDRLVDAALDERAELLEQIERLDYVAQLGEHRLAYPSNGGPA